MWTVSNTDPGANPVGVGYTVTQASDSSPCVVSTSGRRLHEIKLGEADHRLLKDRRRLYYYD